MKYEFYPKGVCSNKYVFEIENNVINSCEIIGGCPGNTLGISKILVGMDLDKVIESFEGTDCHGKGTSCPDQIAKALKQFKVNN